MSIETDYPVGSRLKITIEGTVRSHFDHEMACSEIRDDKGTVHYVYLYKGETGAKVEKLSPYKAGQVWRLQPKSGKDPVSSGVWIVEQANHLESAPLKFHSAGGITYYVKEFEALASNNSHRWDLVKIYEPVI